MHNGAFDTLLMPHTYSLSESTNVDDYPAIMKAPDFGGASVTIPHKESIIQFCDEMRGAAEQIGAVNTVLVETEGVPDKPSVHKWRLVGYNTDWIGMRRPIARLLGSRTKHSGGDAPGIGLVIGAGNVYCGVCAADCCSC
jgi:pentafunctional AROM polypeptide